MAVPVAVLWLPALPEHGGLVFLLRKPAAKSELAMTQGHVPRIALFMSRHVHSFHNLISRKGNW
ncbi:MAG: hypothetical protein LBV07_01330 [Syntrophobacterales bacterium]|nr:hypothetical protein [Syntrophobacterales bacterium]